MAQNYQIISQRYLSQNTDTVLYTCPTGSNTVINTIYVCNQSAQNANVDLIVRPSGEELANKHYILKDQLIDQVDTLILNLNVTMNADTVLIANNYWRAGEALHGNVSVSVFGVDVTGE